jgi:hypothetical protein
MLVVSEAYQKIKKGLSVMLGGLVGVLVNLLRL